MGGSKNRRDLQAELVVCGRTRVEGEQSRGERVAIKLAEPQRATEDSRESEGQRAARGWTTLSLPLHRRPDRP
ncbi:hypothetical protein KM043_007414 [Ampulex compressa]|nr:hypothetical protein KM043_007414 [Ampulex compressa]